MSYFVIDIGGSSIKWAVMADDGTFRLRRTEDHQAIDIDGLVEHVGALLDGVRGEFPAVKGVAMSYCGTLDPARGYVFTGGALRYMSEVDFGDRLEARCGLPVSIENDSNCAAIAELERGALRGVRDGAVLVLGTGIGGTFVLDGRIHHGFRFSAGEPSFLLIRPDTWPGERMEFAMSNGVGGLVRRASERTGLPVGELDGRRVFDLVDAGDQGALDAVRHYAADLAVQIFNLQCLFDLEVFAIGGGISARSDLIEQIAGALTSLYESLPQVRLPRPEIRVCEFRNDANLVGALLHHLTRTGHPES